MQPLLELLQVKHQNSEYLAVSLLRTAEPDVAASGRAPMNVVVKSAGILA